jgi:hypothetical protein
MRSRLPEAGRIDTKAKPATPESNTSSPDDRDRVIESLAQLLSSGRPLSEVLARAKQLAETLPEPTATKERHPTPVSATAPVQESGTPDHRPSPMDRPRAELAACGDQQEAKSIRLGRLTLGVALWLIPAIIIAVLATAAVAVYVNLPRETPSSFFALSLTAKPDIEPIEKAEAALERNEQKLTRPPVAGTKQRTSELPDAAQQLSAEHVTVLLARGDELVKRADVSSGRLFYERAAAAGSAQAALCLGASYDPSFLVQAAIKGVRGDPALAAHWYKRARELGAVVEAEALLKGLDPPLSSVLR